MAQIITATYEGGLLRREEPLDLPPSTKVRLIIEPLADSGEIWRQEVYRKWNSPERLASGEEFEEVLDELTIDSGEPRPTRDQLYDRH
jgi:predicted DNA-binding antitoxin AbrB/MazE fold protein